MPGLASTVEERSLCDISSEGTVVRNTLWICLLRREKFSDCLAQSLTETSDNGHVNHPRNLDLGKLLRSILLYEWERSLNKSTL